MIQKRKRTRTTKCGDQHLCIHCKRVFSTDRKNYFFNESGSGYSTKLTRCPRCRSVVIVEYKEDRDWEDTDSLLSASEQYTYINTYYKKERMMLI